MREACATCEMGYVRAIYVFLMRLFLVHIDRHTAWHFFFVAVFQHSKFPPPTPTDFFHHLFSRQTTEVAIQVDLI